MKKIIVLASILAITVSLFAKQYPDSVRQASAQEPNIATGWNFEFAGGVSCGSYTYSQLFTKYQPAHVVNKVHFPGWNGSFGISYYFVPWMGIGTGLQFSTYVNNAAITHPWTTPSGTYDKYGEDPMNEYTLTATPNSLSEYQDIYMLEVPIALKFRYRPGIVGLTATAGMKIGIPMYNAYKLSNNGVMKNQVYYPFFDLTMENVPTVVEDLDVPYASGHLSTARFNTLNYAAYAELGMLIHVHQRVDLAITAFANYYANDLLASHSSTDLGFADGRKSGEYPMPYTEAYDGVLNTNEVQTLHPWSAGLKIGIQVDASRTKAERAYDKEQRRLRKEQREAERQARQAAEEQARIDEQVQEAVEVQEEEVAAVAPVIVPIVVIDDTVPEVIEDTMPAIVEDTVPEEVWPEDPVERAILQIMKIAEEAGIDMCEDVCVPIPVFIHDTIYVDGPAPKGRINTAAVTMLDEELKGAVIYFDLDKAIPILQPKNILVRIADILKRYPDQKIHVNGHACKLGKPGYNKRLALRRAKAVAAKLKALGVRDDQMIIASFGSEVPYTYNAKHQLSKDRRVEIIPVGKKK